MSKIKTITARSILDSDKGKTIEVTIKTDKGHKGVASVPQGKSKGSGEVPYVSVPKALKNVKVAEKMLKGIDVTDQKKIDEILLSPPHSLSSSRRR
ncbi:MAG: phosphopyruvate hydratase, partial [bacterium]